MDIDNVNIDTHSFLVHYLGTFRDIKPTVINLPNLPFFPNCRFCRFCRICPFCPLLEMSPILSKNVRFARIKI